MVSLVDTAGPRRSRSALECGRDRGHALNLFTVPPDAPFLDAIATEWLRRAGHDPMAVSGGLILVPTRRAARALAEAFLKVTDGRPLLLPRISAIGAPDEAPLALAHGFDLPQAVEPAQRLAVLSRMILGMEGAGGAPSTADRAWLLAAELCALMDEAERAGIDLGQRLPDVADPAFAEHWRQTLSFLHIVTAAWPEWLAEEGMLNPADRQVRLLEAQAEAWAADPPREPVWVAGATGGVPAVARLLGAVARLPEGAVVLPGLDLALSPAAWDAIDDGHPQAGMRRLLAEMGAVREEVRVWPAVPGGIPAGRLRLLRAALLPAAALDWFQPQPAPVPPAETKAGAQLALALPPPPRSGERDIAADSLPYRLETADGQEEAVAIAMILRDALETPGRRAALVTPDRDLARRVAVELGRFGVVADDSAGEPLAETPPGTFLRLLVRAVAEELAPVPLLGLLKHPLAAAGLAPADCRAAARWLERLALRGPRPQPGLGGLRRALDRHKGKEGYTAAADLLWRVERCLEPVLRLAPSPAAPRLVLFPQAAFVALLRAAEALAATDEAPGPARLWAAEEGEALASHLVPVLAALACLPEQPRDILPGLLDAVLEGAVVRSRRALRGRDGAEHPRVFIWGLLEARLQAADVMVLGGLAEGVWPQASDPGPWMSRLMRARAGLPSPEERVGQAAHDFVSAACAAPFVVLSCPQRRDGVPTVPARWLERIRAFLRGRGASLPLHPAAGWVRKLDQPDGGPVPVRPPEPRPAVHLRPRKLGVTEIETWLRDPYAIYAKHVLRLRPLDPIEQPMDAADFGTVVHAGLHLFLREAGAAWPPDPAARLRECLDRALTETQLRPALTAWWGPRLRRIAAWVAATEAARRADGPPPATISEANGACRFLRPGGAFTLAGRADRIERAAGDGRITILDYKTGTPPSQKSVDAGLAPQLPLEAAMAREGAFGPAWQGEAAALTYWKLTGGFVAGEEIALFNGRPADVAEGARRALHSLLALIDRFDDPAQPYLAQPDPARAPRFPQYAQLARVGEWGSGGDCEE
ncbi:MAG: double-strand break repair protein AddB [Acetobacteraceae bacterium]|nr:double-strand break repair protein AddB [Acetobacteraceae bacterium]